MLFITCYAGSMEDGELAGGMEIIAKPLKPEAVAAQIGAKIGAMLGIDAPTPA